MNLKIFSLLLAVSISLVFAGPACKIEIRNETPHRLVNRGLSSHQMAKWDFPSVIKAGTSATVEVEFSHAPGETWEEDYGFVNYGVVGMDQNFTIGANHDYPPPNGNQPHLYLESEGEHHDIDFIENSLVVLVVNYDPPNRMNIMKKIQFSKGH